MCIRDSYWRTQIDGTDYSFRSKEQVREEILNPSVAYELQIYGREDMQDIVKPDQVGMTYVYDNTLDRINAQLTGLKWPMMFFGGRDFELPKAVTYSDDALAEQMCIRDRSYTWAEASNFGQMLAQSGIRTELRRVNILE